MSTPEPIIEVYSSGPTTVVGFGGRDLLDDVNVAACREDLMTIIRDHQCKVLAFDLTGVVLVPSGLLGLLASMRREGLQIHLYNPSDDVREVLSVTHLDQVMPVHELDIDRRNDG